MELITELVNKIKKSIRLVILIFGLVGVCNLSCSKNDGINDGILDYYYTREASYKIEPDTLYVSSSPYDCIVWVTNKIDVKDTISVWDYIQVDEYAWNDQTSPMHDRWHLYSNGGDTSSNCTSFTRYDWLEFTIVEKCGKKGIRIKASENNSDHMRGVRIYVCKEEGRTTHMGQLFFFQRERKYTEEYTVKFEYKGKLYESIAYQDAYGTVHYKNADVQMLIDDLSNKSNVETFVLDEETVRLYEKEDAELNLHVKDLITQLDGVMNDVNNAKYFSSVACDSRIEASPFNHNDTQHPGFYAVFEDSDFEGDIMWYNFLGLMTFRDITDLRELNFNDKISSVAIAYNDDEEDACSILVLWDDINWNSNDYNRSKHRICFVASKQHTRLSFANLRAIPYFNGSSNWNDKASSLSFFFGSYGNVLPDY